MLFDAAAPLASSTATSIEAFAGLVSEIIVAKNQYSDHFRRGRRRDHLSLSAESQWRQLPPLTLTRPDFTVAGALEPAYEMGGDAFDYSHNPDGLRFDITDAMGHGIEAMLLSLAAAAALRHARIQGLSLEAAYRSADRILIEQFGESRYVTGVIGHFEPVAGVLTWINAGHPLPLLIRDRAVTGPLTCAPSHPMGLGGPVVEIGQQQLQPGDRILFYTDGVTEARKRGEQFGLDRLVDHLERASLAGLDAAETLRRLSLAVLAHHDYELNDDSSLLPIENTAPAAPPD
jgi:serine phosphatase RsbU (regulator of sigma subunit)